MFATPTDGSAWVGFVPWGMIMKQIGFGIDSPFLLSAGLGARSFPQLLCVEPDRATPLIANLFHHVLRAARSVAALAVPQADKVDFVRAEAQCCVQHPAIVALVGVLALLCRAKLTRRDMQCAPRLGAEKSRPPILVGEVDRLLEEGRLLERDVDLKQGGARERVFREQQITAAGAAANAKVIRAD